MAFDLPALVGPGDAATSTWANQIRDALAFLSAARTPYTPTITASVSNPTLTFTKQEGRFLLVDKLCFVTVVLHIATVTGAGSGDWIISLPADPKDLGGNIKPVLSGVVWDNSATTRFGVSAERTAASAVKLGRDGSSGFVTHAAPFAWAANDGVYLWGSYEVA